MNVKRTTAAALALSAALIAAPALADGFSVYENSARGVGMAGAMMFSDEASLVAYNPAGLYRLTDNGRGQFAGAVTYIAPRGHADFYDGNGSLYGSQHNKNNPAYVPTLFWAKKLNSTTTFGLGMFARFGLRATFEPGWLGRFSNRSISFTGYSISPAVSWKLSPRLAFGVTAEVMYAGLKMDKSLNNRLLGGEVPMDLDGDSWGYGWGAGLDWQATDKLSLAFLYRSEVKQTVEGDVNLHTPLGTIGTTGKGSIHLPESYTFGVGWKFDDRTRLELNAIKTMWSSYDVLGINVGVPAQYRPLLGGMSVYPYSENKNWRNGWRYNVGLEHKLNEKWTIRCGFTYDTCSSNDPATADFMVPTGTRRTYTVGASWRNKNVEYSFAYGYMYVSDKRIDHGDVNGNPAYTRDCDAHIISLGARIDL